MHKHASYCSRENGSWTLLLSSKNSVEKLKKHICGKELQKKWARTARGSVQADLKSFFWIKEPRTGILQLAKYAKLLAGFNESR